METPQLIESSTRRYLNQILRKINEANNKHYNLFFNIYLFLGFTLFVSLILYFKYKHKQLNQDLKEEQENKKEELIDLIYYYQQEAKKKANDIFTGLPIWKNEFEPIEKCF
jgi:hypothetical protein